MAMPGERARALRFAGEVLREMLTRADVPDDLKQQARVPLRHHPTEPQLKWMIDDVSRAEGVSPCWLSADWPSGHGHSHRFASHEQNSPKCSFSYLFIPIPTTGP